MSEAVADLLCFIDASPSPYHAVAESVRRLQDAGFSPLFEDELWDLAPGQRAYVVRHDGSLVAFSVGAVSPVEGGFRVVGAHTDSPNLRVKPIPDADVAGYKQIAVEVYGAALLHTWLDRDLSLAGRVTLRGDAGTRTRLVDFKRPLLRIPNLAIHLQRELNKEGLKLNAQRHLPPIVGLEGADSLAGLLVAEFSENGDGPVAESDILAFDLMTHDVQNSTISGACNEFICAPQLDNLGSCHAALTALISSVETSTVPATRVTVLYDHEEVGSRSAQGAAGSFLSSTLERLVAAFSGRTDADTAQGGARALARSMLISADMAHAVHPNYVDRHEPGHRPQIGKGPVIKLNANQSYASDARTAGEFADLCGRVGITPQYFVSRSDLKCGSTIGPITAARVGIRTVDVGNPMLSMHSCREMAGTADVEPMIDVLRLFFDDTNEADNAEDQQRA
ncbi:MAG: M18 family aminopeptidase [Myxococcota bacterium]